MPRRRPAILASLATAMLLAPPAAMPARAQEQVLPQPSGPYAVGRRFEDWTDSSRIDGLAPEPGVKRRLPVTIWYPAPPSVAGNLFAYLPEPVRGRFAADAAKQTHAIDGAPLAGAAGERFPVILLKAAFGFLALQHSVIAERLASEGYIVVGSDSPYTTPLVVYRDGTTAARTDVGAGRSQEVNPDPLAPAERNGATLVPFAAWVADNRFVADRLERLNAEDPTFAGRVDLEKLGAMGHSYGGAAALEFCRVDKRCKAAVDMDGAVLGEVVAQGSATPSLFIWSDRPVLRAAAADRPADARPLLEALDRISASLPNRPNQLLLTGAEHFSFTDAAMFVTDPAVRNSGAIGTIDPALGHRIIGELLTGFFDTALKGVSAHSVTDVIAVHPELVERD